MARPSWPVPGGRHGWTRRSSPGQVSGAGVLAVRRGRQRGVAGTVPDQRLGLRARHLDRKHLADEHGVIAAGVRGRGGALERGQRVVQEQRAGVRAAVVRHAGQRALGVVAAERELAGERLAVQPEHGHGEPAGGQHHVVEAGGVLDADEQQQRVERHGRDTVGGDRLVLAVRPAGADQGDPGREQAHRVAEGALPDRVGLPRGVHLSRHYRRVRAAAPARRVISEATPYAPATAPANRNTRPVAEPGTIRSPSARGSDSTTTTSSHSTGCRTPTTTLPVCRTASLVSTTLPATPSSTQIGSGTVPTRSGTRNASTSASPNAPSPIVSISVKNGPSAEIWLACARIAAIFRGSHSPPSTTAVTTSSGTTNSSSSAEVTPNRFDSPASIMRSMPRWMAERGSTFQ